MNLSLKISFSILIIAFTFCSISFSQDLENSHIVMSNHTSLELTSVVRVEGHSNSIEIGNSIVRPWEGSNYHDLNDRILTTILDVVFNVGVTHKDNPNLVELKRFSFSGGDDYSVEVDILSENQLLFTILFDFQDVANSLQNPSNYNIRYPDGDLDVQLAYSLLYETNNNPHQANRDFVVDGVVYKLIYGSFDIDFDPTNNIIFSLSEKEPVTYNMEPNAADVEDPTILNVLTYNIGLLMPLNANDQDEEERMPVLHNAIPKNMDVIIWQEMFEQGWVNRLMDSLINDYPYNTRPHNQASLPGLTKNGGCLIMSKFPILEEDDFSYLRDAGIQGNEESALADKGVKYAKIDKHGQIIHVFNTHTSGQAEENDAMGNFMRNTIQPNFDDIVIMGGDMNTKIFEPQYYQMIDSLEAIQPTYYSLQNEQVEMKGTTWGYNHFSGGREDSASFIDYVFVNQNFKVPTAYYNETQAYRLNITDKKSWGVFDMGDHQPVYARMEFPTISATITDTSVCPSDNFEINVTTSLQDFTVEWYKNGILIEGEEGLVLTTSIVSESDYGLYECFINYSYSPDESVNETVTYHPQYVSQVAIPGKLLRSFNVGPIPGVCDIVSSTLNSELAYFKIYPNPVSKELNIEVNQVNQVNQLGSLEIYSATGQLAYSNDLKEKSTIIDIETWLKGVYTININVDGKTVTRTFIKQ